MSNNDIHSDEQGTQLKPMKAPALTNEETAPQDVPNIQSATSNPAAVLDTPKELAAKAEESRQIGPNHRGTVTHPESDKRLKRNKKSEPKGHERDRFRDKNDVRDLIYKRILKQVKDRKGLSLNDLERKASLVEKLKSLFD